MVLPGCRHFCPIFLTFGVSAATYFCTANILTPNGQWTTPRTRPIAPTRVRISHVQKCASSRYRAITLEIKRDGVISKKNLEVPSGAISVGRTRGTSARPRCFCFYFRLHRHRTAKGLPFSSPTSVAPLNEGGRRHRRVHID